MKDSFVFYSSYADAILQLDSAESQMNVLKALFDFAFREVEPLDGSLNKIENIIFSMARPTIEASKRNYELGQKGGRPSIRNAELEKAVFVDREKGLSVAQIAKGLNISERTVKYIIASAKNSAKSAKTNDNVNVNETVNANVNETVNVNANVNENVKENLNNNNYNNLNYIPTLSEIENFAKTNNLKLNIQEFFDYYESTQWQNVYNWQKLLLKWENNQKEWKRKEYANNPYAKIMQ